MESGTKWNEFKVLVSHPGCNHAESVSYRWRERDGVREFQQQEFHYLQLMYQDVDDIIEDLLRIKSLGVDASIQYHQEPGGFDEDTFVSVWVPISEKAGAAALASYEAQVQREKEQSESRSRKAAAEALSQIRAQFPDMIP